MKMTLGRFALLATGLVARSLAAPAQQPAPAGPTAAELKKNFARIAAGTEGESESFDKLTATTTRRLVAYLKTHDVSAAEARQLGLGYLDAKDATHLKVFTYSYESGGTRGTIHRPVLQWQNAAGQRFAYASSEECEFTESHKLVSPGRTQYLLLGGDRGSGMCQLSAAYVVELKGNYLLINSAAFSKNARADAAISGSDALILCNVSMEFDDRKQVLRLASDSEEMPAPKGVVLTWKGTRFEETK